MASTVSDSGPGAARWRSAQRGLLRLLQRDLRGARRLLDPERLQASVPVWIEAVHALVVRYAEVAAALGAEYYDSERADAGVPGVFTVPVAGPPPQEQTEATLRWATKDLWPRPAEEATPAQLEPLDERLARAERRAEGAVDRLVLGAGRDTVLRAVEEDREAVAFARAAALGACAFCKLMASRGAVYTSAGAAGQDADDQFRGEGTAKFHDWCSCVIVPVFRGQRFELSPQAARWDEIYREYAQGHSGEQMRLFRRALAEHDGNPLPGSS